MIQEKFMSEIKSQVRKISQAFKIFKFINGKKMLKCSKKVQ